MNSPANKLVFLLGGARSGKSIFAEQCALAFDNVLYFATALEPANNDTEFSERIKKHKARRPAHWKTFEPPDSLELLTEACHSLTKRGQNAAVVVDCATLWLAGVLTRSFDHYSVAQLPRHLVVEAEHFLQMLTALPATVFVVSNEVGEGVVPPAASGRLFRDSLGQLNMQLMEKAQWGCVFSAGRALMVKRPQAQENSALETVSVVQAQQLIALMKATNLRH
jgi:adenosylcobinamide kinase/adenosylcobinamide-phosphate guanylyltransferase